MLNLTQLRDKLRRASAYSDLYNYPMFQQWKEDVVEKRLEGYKQVTLNTDPESVEHKRNLIRYQELEYITEGIFRVWKAHEDALSKKLKEMS